MEPIQSSALAASEIQVPWYYKSHVWYALAGLGFIIGLIVLSKWGENDHQHSAAFRNQVKTLIKHATRWHSIALQDKHLLIKFMHSNYALSYAKLAREMVSDKDIQVITGVEIVNLIGYLEKHQAEIIKQIGEMCEALQMDGMYSVGTGWV